MSGTVCLTFDFDAVSRGAFGARAAPRILRLLESRAIPSTWFAPGHSADTYPMMCRDVALAGHEVGLHRCAHEPLSPLDAQGEREIIAWSMDTLCKLTGRPPVGNRTPSRHLTEPTVDLLMEFGIEYDSSATATGHTPYYARTGEHAPPDGPYRFGAETELVELPVSGTLDDVRHMVHEEPGGVSVITFHAQGIGHGDRMVGLEWLLDRLTELGVTFATCADTASSFRRTREVAA